MEENEPQRHRDTEKTKAENRRGKGRKAVRPVVLALPLFLS
jgi:hypothetical protein